MSFPQQTLDPRTRLRALVADIDRELAAIDAGTPSLPLWEAWRTLVHALALGPEPDVRRCPRCGATCMRAASRCGYCWIPLTALAATPPVAGEILG